MFHSCSIGCRGSLSRRYSASCISSSRLSRSRTDLISSKLLAIGGPSRALWLVPLYVASADEDAPPDLKHLETPLLEQPGDCLATHAANACRLCLGNPVLRPKMFGEKG